MGRVPPFSEIETGRIEQDSKPSVEEVSQLIQELIQNGEDVKNPELQALIEEMQDLIREFISEESEYEVSELNRHKQKYGKAKKPLKKRDLTRGQDLDYGAFRKIHRYLARCPKFSADSKNVSVLTTQNSDAERKLLADPSLTPSPTPDLQNKLKNQHSNAPTLRR